MKTKKLIELLQKEDPTGEEEVSVGNQDIFFVAKEPAYYDGRQQVLIRDWDNKYYNVIGAKYRSRGSKIVIHTHSIADALWENPDLPVDYSELGDRDIKSYRECDQATSKASIDCQTELELENFVSYCKNKAADIYSDTEEVPRLAREFFLANLKHDDPMPKDIPYINESWNSRRHKQWDREVDIQWVDLEFQITKK